MSKNKRKFNKINLFCLKFVTSLVNIFLRTARFYSSKEIGYYVRTRTSLLSIIKKYECIKYDTKY